MIFLSGGGRRFGFYFVTTSLGSAETLPVSGRVGGRILFVAEYCRFLPGQQLKIRKQSTGRVRRDRLLDNSQVKLFATLITCCTNYE